MRRRFRGRDMEISHIRIELPAEAWNIIFRALGRMPYDDVKALIEEIKKQGDAQITQPE